MQTEYNGSPFSSCGALLGPLNVRGDMHYIELLVAHHCICCLPVDEQQYCCITSAGSATIPTPPCRNTHIRVFTTDAVHSTPNYHLLMLMLLVSHAHSS